MYTSCAYFTLCMYTLTVYFMFILFTLCIAYVHTLYIYLMCILYMYTLCVYFICILYVYTLCVYFICILWVYTLRIYFIPYAYTLIVYPTVFANAIIPSLEDPCRLFFFGTSLQRYQQWVTNASQYHGAALKHPNIISIWYRGGMFKRGLGQFDYNNSTKTIRIKKKHLGAGNGP